MRFAATGRGLARGSWVKRWSQGAKGRKQVHADSRPCPSPLSCSPILDGQLEGISGIRFQSVDRSAAKTFEQRGRVGGCVGYLRPQKARPIPNNHFPLFAASRSTLLGSTTLSEVEAIGGAARTDLAAFVAK